MIRTFRANALPWLLLSIVVIVLDQLSKWFALRELTPYMPHAVIPGLLNWTLAFNTGAAFSFLSNGSGWQTWLFAVLAIAVSAVLIVWLSRTSRGDWRTAAPLALVIGGALGNLVDRLVHGQVTDFIQVFWRVWSWPAFNLADSAICVGAVALIAFGLFAGHRDAG